jgi:hypothetical protein
VDPSAACTVESSRVSGSAGVVIIVASGPSLRGFPFYRLKGRGYVIAVNAAARVTPFADAWITVDTLRLAERIPHVPPFQGERYVAAPEDYGRPDAKLRCDQAERIPTVHYLRRINQVELAEDPAVVHGLNSAFGALNFAYHLKPQKIVLFGVDASKLGSYFYGARRALRKQTEVMARMPDVFASAVPQLEAAGIEVINASPDSAVTCFRRMDPETALRKVLLS